MDGPLANWPFSFLVIVKYTCLLLNAFTMEQISSASRVVISARIKRLTSRDRNYYHLRKSALFVLCHHQILVSFVILLCKLKKL